MPTANEVDTRPVAVGKWPRHRHNSHHYMSDRYLHRQQQQSGRRKCGTDNDDNCVQKYDSGTCLDVLLRPELLHEIYGDRGIFNSSSNPLLEFCLDGGYLKDAEGDNREDLSSLLELCSDFSSSFLSTWAYPKRSVLDEVASFEERLEHICQTGCDINVQSSQGFTALHFLINGCSKESFDTVSNAVTILLRHGLDVTLEDCDGNNSLTFLARLLERQLYDEALELAKMLLRNPKCDANSVNSLGRSLLSHSVSQGDACADLTRLLLNHGAQVLPFRASQGCDACDVSRERDSSAFTWFLRAAMRCQDLSQSSVTLKLLCDALAVEPEFMRTHVLSTMLHLGQQSGGASSPSMASLFVDLKSFMAPYWRQPLPLRYLCVNRIRGALGPKNITIGAQKLNLPTSLLGHLHLN